MKTRKLLLAALLLACIAPLLAVRAQAKDIDKTLVFAFDGHNRKVSVFIPERSGPMPCLVLLHGSGRDGATMIEQWRSIARKEGILLVAPNAYDSAGWDMQLDSPQFLRAAVDRAAALAPVDRSRLYLFGHSAGAAYSLLLAILDSASWAAIAVHAGAVPERNYDAFGYAHRRMPLAVWVGDSDPRFPLATVKETVRRFQQAEFPTQFQVIPNHDHDYYAIAHEINTQAWNFLKTKTLTEDASGAQ